MAPSLPTADPAKIRFAVEWLATEKTAGAEYGRELLSLPAAQWRSAMERDINLRRYGTLDFVLETVRSDLFQSPARARERAAVVVAFAERVAAPFEQHRAGLAGLAWREYANALKLVGEYPDAIAAAKRSYEIFDSFGSFACDAAKAQLVEALVHRELGNLDLVLRTARRCAQVFLDHEDSEAYVKARMAEALALLDARRFVESMEIFKETAAVAEQRGDRRSLAICLHNTAECARALGDAVAAKELDARALAHFDQLGTSIERPYIRWTYAMTLADEGRIDAAISELYMAQADFIALGMNSNAAVFGIDIVMLRFDRGDDVSSMCSQLVSQFMRVGMVQSAIEALAYLREQAERGTMSQRTIQHVRDFVQDITKAPSRLFLPLPLDSEEEGGA